MPKHVDVPYVENTLYSTNKYSCVRPVHTLYISYYAVCNDNSLRPFGDIFEDGIYRSSRNVGKELPLYTA